MLERYARRGGAGKAVDSPLLGIIPYQKNRTLIVDFAVENSKNLEIMKQKRAATDEISRQRLQEGERGPASPKRSRETDKDEVRY